jgi:rSAM/selenodomain-associated transferase 1
MNSNKLNSTQIKSTAIAIFVKTPGLSPVKTRLASSIGTAAAEEFYNLSTETIQQTLLQNMSSATETVDKESMDIVPFWAVGEPAGLDHPLWQSFESIYTGEGDLGERQYHIYQYLLAKYQRVILIGADSPQLSEKHLSNAITALDSHQFALGPAVDGGYYLLAGRAPIAKDIWTGVTYSSADTAQQLLAQLPSKAALLDYITDVDTIEDLAVLERELRIEKPLNESYKKLIDYIVRTLK